MGARFISGLVGDAPLGSFRLLMTSTEYIALHFS